MWKTRRKTIGDNSGWREIESPETLKNRISLPHAKLQELVYSDGTFLSNKISSSTSLLISFAMEFEGYNLMNTNKH